jgi:type I restriction enzyme S subunit
VIADLENGWSPKCHDRPATDDEWGVLKLGAVSFGVFDQVQNKALPTTLKPQPRLEITSGQVLISRANITRLVGATAYVGQTRPKLMLCDKIFRCVFHPTSKIDPEFTAEVLRTAGVREQIEANVTGTSPTMKNISKPALLALTFPLPPIETQRALVTALGEARAKAATFRKEAEEVRLDARTTFEAAVYANEDAQIA